MKANIDDVTLLTRNKLEIFQSIFKQILDVCRKTTNLAILLELGRYPISTYMHYHAIKYFSRLSSIDSERLLHEAYNPEKEKIQIGETGFCNYVTCPGQNWNVKRLKGGQIEHDRSNILEKPVITKAILIRFNDAFSQTALAHIQNTNKLSFLKSLKGVYDSEKCLQINYFSNRKAITKLRTSNHTLAIEAGRWTNIERENRLCKQCTLHKIEDEIHFLFHCTKYTAERQKTFETIKIKTNIDLSINENINENLKLLFDSDSLSSLKHTWKIY